jgi:uncharacterized protein YndB with AHSA1/START domain
MLQFAPWKGAQAMHDTEVSIFVAAPIEKVWAAITQPEVIRAWMEGSPAVLMDLQPGGAYSFDGGATSGRFTKIEPPTALEYTWRMREWGPDVPDSTVTWKLKAVRGGTDVDLYHDGYPNESLFTDFDAGWDVIWLGPLKEWLEG